MTDKTDTARVIHNIDPIYDHSSKILILGSFPSVKSRTDEFYYAHPQNRFWKVLSAILGWELPLTKKEKIRMLSENGIALWDVIAQCDIRGSSDASIENVIINDISEILSKANISAVFLNGGAAYRLFERYTVKQYSALPPYIQLPSTSPANASFSLDKLVDKWKIINEYIKK